MRSATATGPDSRKVFDTLRTHVGAWYEKAYGSAGAYEKSIAFYAHGTQRRVDILLGPLKDHFRAHPPDSLLDVGCGYASIPILLASWWPDSRVRAIDAVDHFYPAGRAAAAELGLSNIEFDTCPVGDLESAGEYDLVLSTNMLNFMTSRAMLDDALSRLASATKRGGYLIVYTPHFWSFREPFTLIPMLHLLPTRVQDGVVRRLGKRAGLLDVRNPSLREITRALSAAGCRRVGVAPAGLVGRSRRTHLTAWFRKG